MNEPVAWIIDANMTDCDDNFIWNTGGYPDWQVKDWIPLYTHPAKTLTDEEIISEWSLTSYDPKTFIWSDEVDADLIIQFARAILRKAQE